MNASNKLPWVTLMCIIKLISWIMEDPEEDKISKNGGEQFLPKTLSSHVFKKDIKAIVKQFLSLSYCAHSRHFVVGPLLLYFAVSFISSTLLTLLPPNLHGFVLSWSSSLRALFPSISFVHHFNPTPPFSPELPFFPVGTYWSWEHWQKAWFM